MKRVKPLKRRPLFIWVVGLGLLLSPIFYYLQEGINEHAMLLDRIDLIALKMGTIKLIGVVLAPVVGALVLSMRPIGWFAVMLYAVYTLAANAVLYSKGQLEMSMLLLFNATGLAAVVYFARREIMSPYFNPRIRGWERAPRYPFTLIVEIPGKKDTVCKTFDINMSGCFLTTENEFTVGEKFSMKLNVADKPVTMSGQVMWIREPNHPVPGVGVKFTNWSWDLRRALRGLRRSPVSATSSSESAKSTPPPAAPAADPSNVDAS